MTYFTKKKYSYTEQLVHNKIKTRSKKHPFNTLYPGHKPQRRKKLHPNIIQTPLRKISTKNLFAKKMNEIFNFSSLIVPCL